MTSHDAGVQFRAAGLGDADEMEQVESQARSILVNSGVRIDQLRIPPDFEEPLGWTLAYVAVLDGRIVGLARLTELTENVIALDQVSVVPAVAGRGIGRHLLGFVIDDVASRGYSSIAGTTFRDLPFNAPFYKSLGCEIDPDPHPEMLARRRTETRLGLDELGARVVMRLDLTR